MIKTPRLPKEDFANFCVLSDAVQRRALERHSTFIPDWTLKPFRDSLNDIFNVQDGMFEFSSMPWAHIERSVKARSRKKPKSEALNLGVAKAAWDWANENRAIGHVHQAEAVPLGAGWMLNYWHGFYLIVDGEVLLPFFDARKGASRLSMEAARLICSINQHYIARGRFRNALPIVFQFPERGQNRFAKIVKFSPDALLTRNQFEPMLVKTANFWREVASETVDQSNSSDPRQGSFGF